jgi:hypothetical protein
MKMARAARCGIAVFPHPLSQCSHAGWPHARPCACVRRNLRSSSLMRGVHRKPVAIIRRPCLTCRLHDFPDMCRKCAHARWSLVAIPGGIDVK